MTFPGGAQQLWMAPVFGIFYRNQPLAILKFPRKHNLDTWRSRNKDAERLKGVWGDGSHPNTSHCRACTPPSAWQISCHTTAGCGLRARRMQARMHVGHVSGEVSDFQTHPHHRPGGNVAGKLRHFHGNGGRGVFYCL